MKLRVGCQVSENTERKYVEKINDQTYHIVRVFSWINHISGTRLRRVGKTQSHRLSPVASTQLGTLALVRCSSGKPASYRQYLAARTSWPELKIESRANFYDLEYYWSDWVKGCMQNLEDIWTHLRVRHYVAVHKLKRSKLKSPKRKIFFGW